MLTPTLLPTIEACSRWGRWLGERAVALAFPPRCPSCRTENPDDLFCSACVHELFDDRPLCERCGAPRQTQSKTVGCSHCAGFVFDFQTATALGAHEGALRQTVLWLKEHADDARATALGRALGRKARERWSGGAPDWIVPVPKHWASRWTTHGGHERLIAAGVAAEWNVPLADGWVYVRRIMRKQSELTVRQRRRNAQGAFATRRWTNAEGARILLVDDVLTTGATASAIARALRKAGVARVDVAVLARGLNYRGPTGT